MNEKLNCLKQTVGGILSGLINVIIFNPFDRALNLATKNHTTIFITNYWKPNMIYQGIHHGLLQRTISYGLWYPLVDVVNDKLNTVGNLSNFIDNQILASTLASGLIGLTISPISSVKQQYWNENKQHGIIKFVKSMYKIGGVNGFLRGSIITVWRDMIFGFVLGYLSFTHNTKKKFMLDAIFATCATAVASPFNYIRVMKYNSECNVKTSSYTIFKNLIKIVNEECPSGFTKRIIYMFGTKFNVGWGSIRVGLGMALSRQLHELSKKN